MSHSIIKDFYKTAMFMFAIYKNTSVFIRNIQKVGISRKVERESGGPSFLK